MKAALLPLALLCIPVLAPAQTPGAKAAAASITEADIRQRIEMIAHDSMGGRDTPSRGLDLAAQWVAQEFKRLGLKPGGDSGTYIQKYPIHVLAPDPDSMFVELSSTGGQRLKLRIGRDVSLAAGLPPSSLTTMPLAAVGARVDSTAAATALKDHFVIWVADWAQGPPANTQSMMQLFQQFGARGVIAVVNNDSLLGQLGSTDTGPMVEEGPPPANRIQRGGGYFIGLVGESVVTKSVPEAAEHFKQLRTASGITPMPDWSATAISKIGAPEAGFLPNTIGILEGTDPALKNEYIVISAHMDHVGTRCGGATPADTICNGADDDASGTVGVVELAEALATPGARPKRSVVFLTVSGEERGLWGSRYFVSRSPVDVRSIVANFNMDMIGRNWKDSVVAIGKEHSDLGATVDRVAAEHTELSMRVLDDQWPQENLYGRSDHYNFAVKGVPVLFFTSGLHDDYHAVTDTPDKIDAEKEARILKLVYFLTQDIANRPERPKWKPESYRKIVAGR